MYRYIYIYFFNHAVGSFNNLFELFYTNPEECAMWFVIPIFIYAGYNSYLNHGSIHWASDRVCTGCSKTWHHSNDGWGFMSFGKKKEKWYQFKACENLEKCNIVGMHRVKWVNEKNT